MNKKFFLVGVIFALLVSASDVLAKGKIDFGGKLDDGDLFLLTSLRYTWETNAEHRERDIEFNYRYQDKSNEKTTNKGLIQLKERYEFADRHYAFGLGRYDYNEFRTINHRTQVNVGWGYKILRTDKIKMSNEFALGYLNSAMDVSDSNSVNEFIYRNSLWFLYKVAPKISFSNKYLYEGSDIPLTRIETTFSYQILENTQIAIKNIYTEDPITDNIISFNIGYSW
jgi:putative salt-induced outer membrane protein YdiY